MLLAQCCNGQELLAALERRNSLKKPGPFCPMKHELFQLLLRGEIELKIYDIPPSHWDNSCPLNPSDIVSLVSEVRASLVVCAVQDCDQRLFKVLQEGFPPPSSQN